MNTEDFNEMKRMLMEDSDFLEFLRASFFQAVQRAVSLKLVVETDSKRCSVCHRPMKMRVNRNDGQFFWGCSGYPTCRCIESATEDEIKEYATRYPADFDRLNIFREGLLEELKNQKEGEGDTEESPKKRKKKN